MFYQYCTGNQPDWQICKDIPFELGDESCVIHLKTFCWVTYNVYNAIVEGKRLKIFTAGSKVAEADRHTSVDVGYYPDLPGKGEVSGSVISLLQLHISDMFYVHQSNVNFVIVPQS